MYHSKQGMVLMNRVEALYLILISRYAETLCHTCCVGMGNYYGEGYTIHILRWINIFSDSSLLRSILHSPAPDTSNCCRLESSLVAISQLSAGCETTPQLWISCQKISKFLSNILLILFSPLKFLVSSYEDELWRSVLFATASCWCGFAKFKLIHWVNFSATKR